MLFGIVYGVLSSAVFSAKSVANSYVAAISSGNYDKANTIADPHVNIDYFCSLYVPDRARRHALVEDALGTNGRTRHTLSDPLAGSGLVLWWFLSLDGKEHCFLWSR